MIDARPAGSGQAARFLLLYGLAWAGGTAAYSPFLALLLPVQVEAMAGHAAVDWLAYTTFAGAVSASLGNLLFGWLSDLTDNRRGWVGAGMVLSSLLLQAFPFAHGLAELVTLIVAWQFALNMMLGPLGAWAGDCVPDRQKGLLGGLIAFSPAFGAATGALVTSPGVAHANGRLVIVAVVVVACVIPVLLFGNPRTIEGIDALPQSKSSSRHRSQRVMLRMWLARLLVQIAEATLFAFLLYWFMTIDPTMNDTRTARIFSMVLAVSFLLALGAGRWADNHNRPILPLTICAAVSGVGLLVMACALTLAWAIIGYVIFGLATSMFLALHSGETLRVLPHPDRRGRDLGIFNLTNTLPSLIMPWLTVGLVPQFGFGVLFAVLALLATGASLLLISLPNLP